MLQYCLSSREDVLLAYSSTSPRAVASRWIANLTRFRKQRYGWMHSQAAQDLYIQEIFAHIGETNRYYVEFGFNARSYEITQSGPNTQALHDRGWAGLLLDGGHENITINLHRHFLFQSNIVELFERYNVPKELDYLSVDMDSHDFYVLRSILRGGYRPRMFTAEYNPYYGTKRVALTLLDPTLATGKVPDGFKFRFSGCAWGASAYALNMLAEEFGYKMVGRVLTLDLFFIRGDLISPTWEVPKFDWYFRTMPERRPLPSYLPPLKDVAILEQVVDYATYKETLDVSTARRRARELLVEHMADNECWKDMMKQMEGQSSSLTPC